MYASIKNIYDKLSANILSMYSILSDRYHRLLSLIIIPTIYSVITNVPFIQPINSGSWLIILANITARAILIIQERHAKALSQFKEIKDINQALKLLLLQSFEEKYYKVWKYA